MRMKQPKLLMDWGGRPVIQQVVHTLVDCGLAPVHVVTGGFSKEIEHSLAGYPVNILFNPDYTRQTCSAPFRSGLKNAEVRVSAALIVLGTSHRCCRKQSIKSLRVTCTRVHRWCLPATACAEVIRGSLTGSCG